MERARQGFLLIELIVAVSILAIGLTLVLRSLLAASAASGIIADKIAALQLIEMRAAQIEQSAEEGGLKDGDESTEVFMAGRKAQLSVKIAPLESGDAIETKEASINVLWSSGARNMDERLVTYFKIGKTGA